MFLLYLRIFGGIAKIQNGGYKVAEEYYYLWIYDFQWKTGMGNFGIAEYIIHEIWNLGAYVYCYLWTDQFNLSGNGYLRE